MYIKHISIKNFRSIEKLSLDTERLVVLCGPNSCGKSNVIDALRFAFMNDSEIDENLIMRNMTSSKRYTPGGVKIIVEISYNSCPKKLADALGCKRSDPVVYRFSVSKNKTPERHLNGLKQEDVELVRLLPEIIYVAPIRQLEEGLLPFRIALSELLKNARKTSGLTSHKKGITKDISDRAKGLLQDHGQFAKSVLKADRLTLDETSIKIEKIYDGVSLEVTRDGEKIPIEQLGTGHQSATIIQMHKRAAKEGGRSVLLIFEEPDNHLHPSTARAIASDLKEISATSQVIMSTHSPIMLNHIGIENVIALSSDIHNLTYRRDFRLAGYKKKNLRSLFSKYDMKAMEPLLCRRIVLVEGESDRQILRSLIEAYKRSTTDQLDIHVIAVGGKHGVYEMACLLSDLDASWVAVLDHDALYSGSAPLTKTLNDTEAKAALLTIDSLSRVIDEQAPRGKGLIKTLKVVRKEIVDPPAGLILYDGSFVEKIAVHVSLLTKPQLKSLRRALYENMKRNPVKLLKMTKMLIWPGTIEESIIVDVAAEDVARDVLIKAHILSKKAKGSDAKENRAQVLNALHELAHEPDIIDEVVVALMDNNCLTKAGTGADVPSFIEYILDEKNFGN